MHIYSTFIATSFASILITLEENMYIENLPNCKMK